MINDVIRIANAFPYAAKFVFVGVENNKTQQIRRCQTIEYVHSVAVCQIHVYLTCLGEMIIFSPRRGNCQFSQPR